MTNEQKIIQAVNYSFRFEKEEDIEDRKREITQNLLDRYHDDINKKGMTDNEALDDCLNNLGDFDVEKPDSGNTLAENALFISSFALAIMSVVILFFSSVIGIISLAFSIATYCIGTSIINNKAKKFEKENRPNRDICEVLYKKFMFLKASFVFWTFSIIRISIIILNAIINEFIVWGIISSEGQDAADKVESMLIVDIVCAIICAIVLTIVSVHEYKKIEREFQKETSIDPKQVSLYRKNKSPSLIKERKPRLSSREMFIKVMRSPWMVIIPFAILFVLYMFVGMYIEDTPFNTRYELDFGYLLGVMKTGGIIITFALIIIIVGYLVVSAILKDHLPVSVSYFTLVAFLFIVPEIAFTLRNVSYGVNYYGATINALLIVIPLLIVGIIILVADILHFVDKEKEIKK